MNRAKPGFRGFRILKLALLALLFFEFFTHRVTAGDDREAVLSLQSLMESSYSRINDYIGTFRKQERVGGKLLAEETILLKFQKPLKVYMKWIEEPFKGTEALYVDGKNDNKLIAHRGGILGFATVSLDPDGWMAMRGNRHPITEVGFGFLIKKMRRNVQMALKYGEFEIIRMGEELFMGRPTTVVEARFTPREGRKYYTSRAVCHIDKELLLPIGAAFYDEQDVLFEKYSYTDVKLNVGLTDKDFSRDNDDYRF